MKAKVALCAIKGEQTLVELAQQFDAHANQITRWCSQLLKGAADLLEGAANVFGGEARPEPTTPTVDIKTLHAKIVQLTLENHPRSGRGQAFWKERSPKPAR